MKPGNKITGQPDNNCHKQNNLRHIFIALRSADLVKAHMVPSCKSTVPHPQKWAKLTSSTHGRKGRDGKALWLLHRESTWRPGSAQSCPASSVRAGTHLSDLRKENEQWLWKVTEKCARVFGETQGIRQREAVTRLYLCLDKSGSDQIIMKIIM